MMFGHDHKDNHEDEHDDHIDAAAAALAASTQEPPATDSSDSSDTPDSSSVVSSLSTPIADDTNSSSDATSTPDEDTHATDSAGADAPSSDLLELKKQALQQLSPLVSELDQTPEETFHTLMMMIQASDDQSLIQKAYDAAEQISDSKNKAQALLDIVNEINYFTQHPSS